MLVDAVPVDDVDDLVESLPVDDLVEAVPLDDLVEVNAVDAEIIEEEPLDVLDVVEVPAKKPAVAPTPRAIRPAPKPLVSPAPPKKPAPPIKPQPTASNPTSKPAPPKAIPPRQPVVPAAAAKPRVLPQKKESPETPPPDARTVETTRVKASVAPSRSAPPTPAKSSKAPLTTKRTRRIEKDEPEEYEEEEAPRPKFSPVVLGGIAGLVIVVAGVGGWLILGKKETPQQQTADVGAGLPTTANNPPNPEDEGSFTRPMTEPKKEAPVDEPPKMPTEEPKVTPTPDPEKKPNVPEVKPPVAREPPPDDPTLRLAYFLKSLETAEFADKLQAVQGLAQMKGKASLAFQPIFQAVPLEQNLVLKNAMIEALETIPPRADDLDNLKQAAENLATERRLRLATFAALEKLGPNAKSAVPILLDQARSQEGELRTKALQAALAIGPESKEVPALVAMLRTNDAPLIAMAAEALGRIGPEAKTAIPTMLLAFKKVDRPTKVKIVQAFANLGAASKEAVPSLQELLKEPDRELAFQAAQSLIKLGEPRLTSTFLVQTVKVGTVEQRKSAIKALPLIGSDMKLATTELLAALDNDELHQDAKEVLMKIGKDGLKSVSQRMLQNMNAKVRMACIEIIREVNVASPEVLNALYVVSEKDPVPENKDLAKQVFDKLKGGT